MGDSLPEDDPDALRIILFIVHYKHELLPENVPFDLFFQLVVLSDKYDMVAPLKPFWASWHISMSGHELAGQSPRHVIQRLWISHALGDGSSFLEAIMVLVLCSMTYDDGQLYFLDFDYDIDADDYLRSLDVLGKSFVPLSARFHRELISKQRQ